MVDLQKIEALAKAATQGVWSESGSYISPTRKDGGTTYVESWRSLALVTGDADRAFISAANPTAVLELIADQKRMASRLMCCTKCGGQGEVYSGQTSYEGYNQPPEPIMDKCGECGGDGVLGDLDECLSILDELEQVKAENAGLKTGYEAYETGMSDLFSKSVEEFFDAWLADDSTHWVGDQDAAWQAWMYVNEQTVEPLNIQISHLKAENAGLKTGYEAYERVNAELRDECERLKRNRDMWKGQVERQSEMMRLSHELEKQLKSECEALRNKASCVDDCAAIIRKLVHHLRKSAPDNDFPEKALDYLKRKGLQGSPMRKIDAAMRKEAAQ